MEYGLVALWLVTYLALLYVSMPIARALVPSLADRGAGIALPLGLALVWTVAYFVGRVSITAGLWLGLAVLAVAAGALWYRGATVDNRQFAETAAVFSLAFLFMVAIRAHDPAAHPGAGEKFLDMGMLQSLLRGSTIPPEDTWFAGETVPLRRSSSGASTSRATRRYRWAVSVSVGASPRSAMRVSSGGKSPSTTAAATTRATPS